MSWLAKLFRRPDPAKLEAVRSIAGNSAAIVLVHGFTGRVNTSFGDLVGVLSRDARFSGYDVFRLQFNSNLRLDLQFVQRQPDIALLGRQLATRLKIEPLQHYRSIYVVAHSMGGLVVESALLDEKAREHVSHVVLIGTPSRGVRNISLLAGLMGQLRDLVFDGPFVTTLRKDWTDRFPTGTPFGLAAVAGDSDELVDTDSSIDPFPREAQMVIAGTHGEIASVGSPEHPLFGVLLQLITQDRILPGDVDLAKLALEQHDYRRVVELLGPAADKLDLSALTTLALAYDGLNRQDDAIKVLESAQRNETDALGILAGRYKRKWLAGRLAENLQNSRSLYQLALEQSRMSHDVPQIWYHAINLAFLDVVASPDNSTEPASAQAHAAEALEAAQSYVPANYWSAVTIAEAKIVTSAYDEVVEAYAQATSHEAKIRDRESTYLNASQLLSKRRRSDLLGPVFTALMK
jgi:pimeloyl-ACP methyl ester carboxylesterase